jgi:CBS domain-containing protein
VALCFAELAGQYPLAGSVYQWSKQIARPFTSWFGGWILTVGSVVTLAAVAVAYQVVAPQVSSVFQIIGSKADIGQVATPGGAKNALLLAAALVVFTTVINMVGVKTMARINNFGVAAELIGVTLLIILLAAHIRRGPGVVLDTFGLGRGYPWGYFGAFLVATLIRTPPLLCPASEPIREAAQRMTAEGANAVLVRVGHRLGIVTDRDFRSRVVAAGVSPDAPVSAVMTEPAYTVTADRLAGEVLLDMLERNVHHVPVLSAGGEVLGVVDDGDLASAQARAPFLLRRAIALTASPGELAAAAAGLDPMIVALHDAQVAAEQVAAVCSVVLDALTRRLVELAVEAAGDPPAPFTWFALGSLARREAVPSSDVDSALAWQDAGTPDAEVGDYMTRVARAVEDGLRACGLRPDPHGASAVNPLFARSVTSWRAAVRRFSEDPAQEKALIFVSLLTDSRPVWDSGGPGTPVAEALWETRGQLDQSTLRRLLARFALSFRPPTGFLRDFVVEHSGEHRGQLDLKHGGLIPIVDLARWAGMGAGVTSGSTRDRLRAAEAAGTLEGPEASTLLEAFGFVFSLRLDHQVEQVRRGEAPDDFIDPSKLNPLARSYLREAFRAVASVQAGLAAELSLGVRWS